MPRWAVASLGLSVTALSLCLLGGALLGLGSYTFWYAEGGSYFSNDPKACINCHVMREHFEAWSRSSHHAVAVCNDCHTPAGFVGKYFTKAKNGFNHSFAFTSGRYPDPFQITPGNRAITEARCRGCHAEIVAEIDHLGKESCIRCHGSVGHLR